jgi:hypothetical protein
MNSTVKTEAPNAYVGSPAKPMLTMEPLNSQSCEKLFCVKGFPLVSCPTWIHQCDNEADDIGKNGPSKVCKSTHFHLPIITN